MQQTDSMECSYYECRVTNNDPSINATGVSQRRARVDQTPTTGAGTAQLAWRLGRPLSAPPTRWRIDAPDPDSNRAAAVRDPRQPLPSISEHDVWTGWRRMTARRWTGVVFQTMTVRCHAFHPDTLAMGLAHLPVTTRTGFDVPQRQSPVMAFRIARGQESTMRV